MKKHLILTSLVAIVATTSIARADDITIDSIKASLNSNAITAPAPSQTDYTYTLLNGTTGNLTNGTTAADYAVAVDSAADGQLVALAGGSEVKLGETMTAADYTYSSKNADGDTTMVAGTTAVTELNKVYTSTYGNITVSTDADPVVDIANYKEVGEGDVVYSLHDNGDGTFSIYNSGVDVTEAFPNKLETLQTAYETDKAAVAELKETLDGYKAYNVANHDAVAGIVTSDNETIADIAANKATWETATANYAADMTTYTTAVANYDNSLGKIVDDKVAAGSVEAVVANAKIAEVTQPAPSQIDYTYTLLDGTTGNLTNGTTAADYAVAVDSAADGQLVALAGGSEVKLGETMTAADYTYSSKNADGDITMVAGTTAVTELSKVYTSTYGNITVSTDADPVVDIANYVSGDYSLHEESDGSIVLYQSGAPELDSPTMLAELKGAYEADKAAVAELKETLDAYKAYNVANHDAVAGIVTRDNETIAGIAANKATWETATANYAADMTTYTTAVANYDNSLSKVINDKGVETLTSAQTYADAGDNATLSSAQTYADTAVSGEAARVDAIMGTVHGLITDANATTTSNGKQYRGNLAVGTTVEDHLLALDESIGDRRTLSGNHVSATGSVVDNLQMLNDDLDAETARAQAEEASIRSDFAAADELTLNAAKAYADNANAFNLQAAKSYTDERIQKLDKDLSAGVASAVALSSVAVSNVTKGEVSVGAGYGYFNGQSAMAFGAAMGLSDRWSINTGAGLSGSDVSFRAGTNYKFKLF